MPESVKEPDEKLAPGDPANAAKVTNLLADIIVTLKTKMTAEEIETAFNPALGFQSMFISYLEFIRLSVKYLLFDSEALKRENVQLLHIIEETGHYNDEEPTPF